MTEVEMLRSQLAEAKEENAALRAALNRKKHLDAYPDEMIERFENLRSVVGRNPCYASTHRYSLEERFTQKVSAIIRSTVFSDTARKGVKNTCFISVQDMNEEEYRLWLDVAEKIMSALDAGIASRRRMIERKEQ